MLADAGGKATRSRRPCRQMLAAKEAIAGAAA